MTKCDHDEIKYFSQICTEEFIDMPCDLPDIEQIVSAVVDCETESLKIIDTMKGCSYEGQHLTGKKLAVEIKIRQKILYVAENEAQSVHILENEYRQSAYIVIPCLIEGTDPAFLIKHKILKCKIDVEDVFVKNIDKRRIFKNLCLLVSLVFAPTHAICCAAHCNCKYSNLFVMHRDGSKLTQVTFANRHKNYKPQWSPNGRDIAYISNENGRCALWVYSIRTGVRTRIAETACFRSIGSYCWSADGAELILSGYMEENRNRELYSVRADNTGTLRQITRGNGVFTSVRPKCGGPGGRKLVYVRSFSGLNDLFECDIAGKDNRRLTDNGCVKHFDWAPDGCAIVCIEGKEGGDDLLVMIDPETLAKNEIPVRIRLAHKKKVKFSPDGRFIAFIGRDADDDDIYVLSLHDRKLTDLSDNTGGTAIYDICWGPDSDRIYCSTDSMFGYDVFMYDLNKEKYQITDFKASKLELCYRPKIN